MVIMKKMAFCSGILMCFLIISIGVNGEKIGDISVELLENTERCSDNCYQKYEVCYEGKLPIFSLQKSEIKANKYFGTVKTLTQSLKTHETKPNCYIIEFHGSKSPYESVDIVPEIRGIEFGKGIWAWWNSTFLYRQNITIYEQTGLNITLYPISFTFNHGGNVTNECIDIRAVRELEELEYAIQNCNSTHVDIALQTYLNGLSNNTISIYYNNSLAEAKNQSWNDIIYNLYDDFDDNSLNSQKWNCVSGSCIESGTIITLSGSDNHLSVRENYRNSTLWNNYIVEFKITSWDTSNNAHKILFYSKNETSLLNTNCYVYGGYNGFARDDYWDYSQRYEGSVEESAYEFTGSPRNQIWWFKVWINGTSTNTTINIWEDSDGSGWDTYDNDYFPHYDDSENIYTNGLVGFENHDGKTWTIDYVKVYSYILPEPIVYPYGILEIYQPPPPPEYLIPEEAGYSLIIFLIVMLGFVLIFG